MFPGFRASCREVQRVGSGRSVTPPARDALSMLAVGAGVVRKRSEGSTGTGGDVEASQVLRRHPPVTDDRLVSSQGQEGWGRGGVQRRREAIFGVHREGLLPPAAAPLRRARKFGERGLGGATLPCGSLRRWKDSA